MSHAKKKKKSSARLEGIVSKLTSVATESQQEKGDATPTKKMPFVKKMPLVKYSVTDQSKQKGDANTNKKKMPVVKKKMPPPQVIYDQPVPAEEVRQLHQEEVQG